MNSRIYETHRLQHLLCIARFHGHEKSGEGKVGSEFGKFTNHLSGTHVGVQNEASRKRPYSPKIRLYPA